MKLKLFEADLPINKIEYNIEKNILPKFKEYGLNFNSKPTKINKYKNLYNGVGDGLFCQLYLNTTNQMIDEWNENNSDLYTADLFGELKMNGKTEQLGPISSADSSSIDEAMKEINVEENKSMSQEKLEDIKIYEPTNKNSTLGSMTKEEWVNLKHELETELDEIRAELQKANDANDDETYYNLYKNTYKDKRDYFDKVFMTNYPFI